MVVSVQGNTAQDISAINQQKIQDFKDGKTKITKNDLAGMLSDQIKQGQGVSSSIVDMIDSYEQIDKNGDGIDYKEFTTYNSSPSAILKSLGLSAGSVNNSINSTLLNSINQQPSLIDSGLFGDSSGSSSTLNSSTSYLNSLMQSYNTSNNTNDLSLADYLT